jgi:hypothetical protein
MMPILGARRADADGGELLPAGGRRGAAPAFPGERPTGPLQLSLAEILLRIGYLTDEHLGQVLEEDHDLSSEGGRR